MAERYSPSRNAWRPAAGLSLLRSAHTATALPDGTVLVCGGSDAQSRTLASAEV
jgi:hypothetical protein